MFKKILFLAFLIPSAAHGYSVVYETSTCKVVAYGVMDTKEWAQNPKYKILGFPDSGIPWYSGVLPDGKAVMRVNPETGQVYLLTGQSLTDVEDAYTQEQNGLQYIALTRQLKDALDAWASTTNQALRYEIDKATAALRQKIQALEQ